MRIKRGIVSRRKHKKLLGLTRGFRGTKRRLVKVAREAALHAGAYAYHGRKLKKRDLRSLWILRIGEAVKPQGLSYSIFMNKLKNEKIELDRKILSDLALSDPQALKKIVEEVKPS